MRSNKFVVTSQSTFSLAICTAMVANDLDILNDLIASPDLSMLDFATGATFGQSIQLSLGLTDLSKLVVELVQTMSTKSTQ